MNYLFLFLWKYIVTPSLNKINIGCHVMGIFVDGYNVLTLDSESNVRDIRGTIILQNIIPKKKNTQL
jgi:hypothetical protein